MDHSKFALNQIGQIALNVADLERATRFYRDILGMQFLFGVPNMSFFQCGGIRLMLALPEKAEFDHPASIIYYQVADIQATFNHLKSLGVHFEEEPKLIHKTPQMELRMAFLRDSENNPLALMHQSTPA